MKSLNPLKRVNSILTLGFKGIPASQLKCLNPLKRVNSILTKKKSKGLWETEIGVSIPSNGSIQFLLSLNLW